MNTLNRYIFKELFPPTLLGIFVFTLIVIGQQLVKISDYIITGGVPISEMGKLVFYSLPAFLEISIPISLILGVSIGFSRLSIDSEIVALRSSGLGLRHILPGVALLALMGFAAVSVLTLYGSASGYRNLYQTIRKVSFYGSREVIKEGVFTALTDSTLIYADHISPDGNTLWGVVLSEKKGSGEPIIITAEMGEKISGEGNRAMSLVLTNGAMNQKMPGEGQRILIFEKLTFRLGKGTEDGFKTTRKPKEIPVPLILSMLKEGTISPGNLSSFLISLHKRLSLPFASIIFSFFAVPLGMAQRSRGKSGSFIVTGLIVLVYYIFIGVAKSLVGFSLPLSIALIWTPNVLFGIITIAAIRRMDRDPSFEEKLSGIFRRRR